MRTLLAASYKVLDREEAPRLHIAKKEQDPIWPYRSAPEKIHAVLDDECCILVAYLACSCQMTTVRTSCYRRAVRAVASLAKASVVLHSGNARAQTLSASTYRGFAVDGAPIRSRTDSRKGDFETVKSLGSQTLYSPSIHSRQGGITRHKTCCFTTVNLMLQSSKVALSTPMTLTGLVLWTYGGNRGMAVDYGEHGPPRCRTCIGTNQEFREHMDACTDPDHETFV